MSDIEIAFQTLIDNAVKDGVSPGVQCVVFDKDQVVFNGVSGYASLPSESNPTGKLMTKSNILWLASCSKLVISLLTLHLLEKGLIEGVSLDDLDNPDALAKVVSEFAPGSHSLVMKIIEGYEDGLGPDGKKIMKLRDVKNRVTLRQLLTHTSGMGFYVTHPLLWQLVYPSDGSTPHFNRHFAGALHDIGLPLLFEPGTGYHYGHSTDWLGQFIIRGTNKHLRQLLKEIITDPLQIPPSEIDFWLSPELKSTHKADMHIRDENPSLPYKFQVNQTGSDLYSAENGPAAGMSYVAEAGLNASSQAYAKILQAVASRDRRILSPTTWDLAFKDDFGPRGIQVTRPDFISLNHRVLLTYDSVPEFFKTGSDNGIGMNLLQAKVALVPTLSGRPAGSFGWGGMPNVYFFVDPTTGFGAVLGTQLVPFFDDKIVELRDQIESVIYKMLPTTVNV